MHLKINSQVHDVRSVNSINLLASHPNWIVDYSIFAE